MNDCAAAGCDDHDRITRKDMSHMYGMTPYLAAGLKGLITLLYEAATAPQTGRYIVPARLVYYDLHS